MMNKKSIKLFENKKVRVSWDEDKEEWYFSIIDVIAILTDSDFQKARNYWKILKFRLNKEGSELVTNCNQLKMLSSDGKHYFTDVGDTRQILRLIQSVPSKKAEPFKIWLAKVGDERINEMYDPELTIERAMNTYLQKGYSKEWINQRLKTIEVRKDLTDEWQRVGIKKRTDFAILTNEITQAWSGKSIKNYKKLKNLKKENLRDNMTNLELIFNMLAEATTKEISKTEDPSTFDESKGIAQEGGKTAKVARDRLEKRLGKTIITSKNAEDLHFKNKKSLKNTKKHISS